MSELRAAAPDAIIPIVFQAAAAGRRSVDGRLPTLGHGMKILVTGASGFIGTAIADYLATAGHDVIAASRRPTADRLGRGHEVNLPDLRETLPPPRFFEGIEAVVHAAGMAHQPRHTSEEHLNRVNGIAAGSIAAAARAAGVKRFVLISSMRAVSGPVSSIPLPEETIPQPVDAYGRSKLSGEIMTREAFPDAVILRPPAVHGAGAKGKIGALGRLALSKLPLPLGGLGGRHSIVSDRNLAAAVHFIVQDASGQAGLLHVSDAEPLGLDEIVRTMRQALGRRPGIVPVPPHLRRLLDRIGGRRVQQISVGLTISNDKIHSLGWQPVEPSSAGLARMVRAAAGLPQTRL